MKTDELFSFEGGLAERLFLSVKYPWEALDVLLEYIRREGRGLDLNLYKEIKREVWVARSACISDSALLSAPIIIDEGARVGDLSHISCSIIGRGSLVGERSEIRRSIFLDFSLAPACNYISDSLVGEGAIFKEGSIASGVRADRKEVTLDLGEERVRTGRVHLGALVGDGAKIGQSAVLSAGTVVERGATVKPFTRARGLVSAGEVYRGERIVYDLL